jgi:hypothetical protein
MHNRIKNKNSANPTVNAFTPHSNAPSSLLPIDCSYKTNSLTMGKTGVITTVNPSTIAAKLMPYPCTHFTRNQQSTPLTAATPLAAAHTFPNDDHDDPLLGPVNRGTLGKLTIAIANDIVHNLPK